MLWLFYGIVAAMTFFNMGAAALLRKREYSLYVGLMVSLGAAIFTLSARPFSISCPTLRVSPTSWAPVRPSSLRCHASRSP